MSRGYFGIGIYGCKNKVNVGTLWRSANIFGADFIFTIGHRYKRQASDVLSTPKHIPLYNYKTFDDFKDNLPWDCRIVAIEMGADAVEIQGYEHPERCVYLLGAEDTGLSPNLIKKCHQYVRLPGDRSLNVSTAGSIVLYDRIAKCKNP